MFDGSWDVDWPYGQPSDVLSTTHTAVVHAGRGTSYDFICAGGTFDLCFSVAGTCLFRSSQTPLAARKEMGWCRFAVVQVGCKQATRCPLCFVPVAKKNGDCFWSSPHPPARAIPQNASI